MRHAKLEFYFEIADRENETPFEQRARLLATAHALMPEGWTLQETVGGWEGKSSPAYILSVIVHAYETESRFEIAKALREEFGQDAVAHTFTPCDFRMTVRP